MSADPEAQKRHKLILDVDTGTDDAVAIMLAALHPALELVACTTVNGNREIEHTTENTFRTLDHIGRGNIPVHAGLRRPIARLGFSDPAGTSATPASISSRCRSRRQRSQGKATERGRFPDRYLSQRDG